MVGYFSILPIISLSTRVLRKSYSKIRFYSTNPTDNAEGGNDMESYVERWAREQREAKRSEAEQKEHKEVTQDGKDKRGKGQETQSKKCRKQ